jgi:2-methylisocitrate lyase-like PEP mutase family enzyme
VTIDVEGGYSDDPRTVVEGLKPVFASGIAGINIEDGSDTPELLSRKIEAIKEFATKGSTGLFINVRTDVFLRNLAPDAAKVDETLKRAALYARAGADGLFVPGLAAADQISAVSKGTALPLNVMAVPGLPPAKALAALGVRRLSAGSVLSQMVWQRFAELAGSFLASGDSLLLSKDAMEYGRLQSLFAKSH